MKDIQASIDEIRSIIPRPNEAEFIVYRFHPDYLPVRKQSTDKKKNEVALKDSGCEPEIIELLEQGNEELCRAIDVIFDIVADPEYELIETTIIHLSELLRAVREPMKSIEDPDKKMKAHETKIKCNKEAINLYDQLKSVISKKTNDELATSAIIKKVRMGAKFEDEDKEIGPEGRSL